MLLTATQTDTAKKNVSVKTGDMLRKHVGFTAHDTAEEFTQ